MAHTNLISKWKELEFKYNGDLSNLENIDFDKYTTEMLRDEIDCLEACLQHVETVENIVKTNKETLDSHLNTMCESF